MAKISVPAGAKELTAEWLFATLKSKFPINLDQNIKLEQIGQDFGFASEIYRVSWVSHNQPHSLIVKLWDVSAAGMGEVHFYRHFKDCGARIPQSFYGAISENGQRGVLILEDLVNTKQGDVLKRLKGEQAYRVAKNLAKMHAAWSENPILGELEWLSEKSIANRGSDWFLQRRQTFLKRFPNHLNGLPLLLLNNIERTPQIVTERLKSAPHTLLHGDFHLDNILFKNKVEPIFLDWARPTKGPLVLNLADLLFSMISLDEFDAVLDCYISEYEQISKWPLDNLELMQQLGGALLQSFAINTCGIALFEPTLPRAIQMIDDGIYHAVSVIDFWHERDPQLFAFLFPKR